jgi:hypothetical protein
MLEKKTSDSNRSTTSLPPVVMIDGFNRIVLAAESIVCAERVDAYVWAVRSTLEMAPGRKKEDINLIFADGIVSDLLLETLGIQDTCHLCLDAYHLLAFDWPKQFGPALWPRLQVNFRKLLYADSEAVYDEAYNSLLRVFTGMGSQSHYNYLINHVHNKRHKFVYFHVASFKGELAFLVSCRHSK